MCTSILSWSFGRSTRINSINYSDGLMYLLHPRSTCNHVYATRQAYMSRPVSAMDTRPRFLQRFKVAEQVEEHKGKANIVFGFLDVLLAKLQRQRTKDHNLLSPDFYICDIENWCYL